ncbi:MAG: Gfo/Idh/MocA family oxidoreductase [Planctomycetota bacterium]
MVGVETAGRPFRVGVIGCGFMGRAHANAYNRVGNFFGPAHTPVLQVACSRDREKTSEFAKTWGFHDVETDWRAVVDRDDIDAVDICVPNDRHREIAVAAAGAGKAVLCEKPLGLTVADGEAMCEAVEAAGVANMVWYNYRRIPAVSLAKQIIDRGTLGRIFHYRADFLQDWTISEDLPQGGTALWRLDAAAAGSGVTGDLLSHCIDTAMWLNGGITEVTASAETFVKQRPRHDSGELAPVGIDDACAFLCRFANGSLGVFESTRYARGHKARYSFEINGEHASIRWDLHDLHRLEFFSHHDEGPLRGWRSVHVTDHDGGHPYMDRWWVPGLQVGYEHSFVHQVADFLSGWSEGRPTAPTFRDALETEKVCEAVLASAAEKAWRTIERSRDV